MSLAKKLYELQQIEQEIQKQLELLDIINQKLSDNTTLLKAKEEFLTLQRRLEQTKRHQSELEWEIENLQINIKQLTDKLYSGIVKNPKELVSLEKETNILKTKLQQKEEELLEVMAEVEELHEKVNASQEQLKRIEAEKQAERVALSQKQAETEAQLNDLNRKRESMLSQIEPQIIQSYQSLKSRKGQAVARIEQGKCQGCHIALPISDWQKVKTGSLAYCSSCGRILFLG